MIIMQKRDYFYIFSSYYLAVVRKKYIFAREKTNHDSSLQHSIV